MSAMGDYLRAEMGLPSKYKLVILDDGSAPVAHHSDGWTKWKNGRPRSYTRAENELRVGQQWLYANFPATYTEHRLTGQKDTQINRGDIEMRQWLRSVANRPTAAQAWERLERIRGNRESDRSAAERRA